MRAEEGERELEIEGVGAGCSGGGAHLFKGARGASGRR
jgi:hypothetical protein